MAVIGATAGEATKGTTRMQATPVGRWSLDATRASGGDRDRARYQVVGMGPVPTRYGPVTRYETPSLVHSLNFQNE